MERRKYRRLPIQLSLVCRDPRQPDRVVLRTRTVNVSTGGLYFETLADGIELGQDLDMELAIPPGDGHFPYQGRVTTCGQVIRVDQLPPRAGGEGITQIARRGVATTFSSNLRLSF